MNGGHVEHLLSRAYDGDLDAHQRALFDGHLSACGPCSAAYADLATVLGAVRGLPPVRMPHPVRLPEGLPRAAGRRWSWSRGATALAGGDASAGWTRLPLRHPWVTGLLGAAATAALIAAIVVPSISRGPGFSGISSSLGNGATGQYSPGIPPAAIPNAPCSGCSSAPACPVTLAPGARAVGTAIPAVYNNREVRDDGVTTAILATSVSSYAPGESVEIYARLVDDRTGTVSLPCAYLEPAPTPTAGPQHAIATPASGAFSAPVPAQLGLADGLSVKVPGTAVPGETLEIVIEVPGRGGEPAHQVDLSITVR